jgi:sugar transferase (PEP-CTERM/EpsH1 system associated)
MQVVFSLEVGGLENLVLTLVGKLNKTKYNISVCSLSAEGKLEDKFNDMGVPVYHVKKRAGIDYSLSFRLAGLFMTNRIDVIHSHNPSPWLYGCPAAKISGVKAVVHTEHSHLDISQAGLMKVERILSKFTDKIISDAHPVTRFLIEKQMIPSSKIETIFNGIDIDRFDANFDKQEIRSRLGISSESLVLGCIARLEAVKDHVTLLESFSIVSNKFPKAILVLVGDGSQKEKLKEKSATLGIREKVLFLGTRMDAQEVIQIFDIFVLSSLSEGLSIALLEAMAARKPIVATNVGGNPDIVLDGETGFLVPSQDKHSLSEKLLSLLSDRNMMSVMGGKGFARVENNFNIKNMVKDYERVYDRCLFK